MKELPPEPKSTWVVRTDAGARKIVERLDALREHQKHLVSWQSLITILGAAAVVVVGAAWVLNLRTEAAAEGSAKAVGARLDSHIQESNAAHQAQAAKLERVEERVTVGIQGVYRAVLTRQRQPEIEAMAEETP